MKKKLASFVVECRYIILAVMLVLAIVSAFLMQKVEVNEDMTKYLPDDSSMKIGMDIMTEEFPEMETSQTIRVMFDDLTSEEKEIVLQKLQGLEYVDSISYDEDSEDYNKDNHTLYVINSNYEYGSEEMAAIEEALDRDFGEYTMMWSSDYTGIKHIPTWVLVSAVCILMVILFVMCGSWIEPILFLVGIGFAVIINMGTNIIMGSVSGITSSISSILQLILSMDYSIILINRYKQEKERLSDNKEAMKVAIENAFSSIVSSAMTTVIGLLMLVFMSFKIGMDLGIVLAKGVFLSMVCVLVLMSGIIISCDKLIQKTSKKELHISMNWAGKFSHRWRYVITGLFVVIMVAAYILQQQTGIVYTLEKEDKVAEVFQADNTLVLVYETEDEASASEVTNWLKDDENVKSVMSYYTMLGAPYTTQELSEEIWKLSDDIKLDKNVLAMFYYDYYAGDEAIEMTASEFLDFICNTVANDELFSEYIDDEMLGSIELIGKFSDADVLTTPMSSAEHAAFFGMDESMVEQLFTVYFGIQQMEQGMMYSENNNADNKMSVKDFIEFINTFVLSNETYASQFDKETTNMLLMAQNMINVVLSEEKYSAQQIHQLISGMGIEIDENSLELMFLYEAAINHSDAEWTMSTEQLLNYLVDSVLVDERFSDLLDEDTKAALSNAKATLEDGKKQLVSQEHSRMIVTTSYLAESEETFDFLKNLSDLCDEKLVGDYHFIGDSAMNYEMSQTFDGELLFITILTAVVIYLIVAISSRSLVIPLILVLLVQTGVYITVSTIGLQGNTIYYLALLIVQCILMGATIDYGILYTNYYVENRKKENVLESLKKAYAGAIHTIATSGLILVIVTAIVGNGFKEPTVAAIVKTLSIGSFVAIVLILFILPGVLSCCDKLIIKKNRNKKINS